jgi:RHS repeat-associated protein
MTFAPTPRSREKTMFTRLIIAAAALALAAPCLAGSKTRTSRFEYDAQGQLIREIIEPDDSTLCLVTTYVLDAHGNRITTTTRNCNGTTSSGVIEAPLPTGDPYFAPRTSNSSYVAGSDVNGAWVEGQFPTTISNALNQQEGHTYDPRFGGVLTLTGPNHLPTTWRYDSFGRKSSEARADGTVSNWFYERCANLGGTCPSGAQYRVRVTATGAPTTSTYYDSFTREVRTETQGFDGTLVLKDTQYDIFGRVTYVTGPYYTGTATSPVRTFVYDTLGRVTQALEPQTASGSIVTLTSYNSAVTATTWSTTVTVTNGYGSSNMPGGGPQSRTTARNSQGQTVQVKDTQNNALRYTYDEFANLATTTDALGNVTVLTNDLRGRKTKMIDPDMGTWIYSYDAASDLVTQTDAKGQVITMKYDALARMFNRTEPDLVSTWTYDTCPVGVGKLCQATASDGYSRTLGYESVAGRLQTLSTTIGATYTATTAYVQSGANLGKVDTVTYPTTGFGIRNVYNAFGYLLEVRVANPTANPAFAADNTLLWHENTQTASGKVTSELLGNGLTQTRTFDPMDRLSSVVAGTVHNLAYTYDALGNVIERDDNVDKVDGINPVVERFAYDTLSRLASASGPGLLSRYYYYDALGNITSKTDVSTTVGGGAYSYPPSGPGSVRPHAVSSISGTVNGIVNPSFAYDANGNLTSGLGRAVSYTSFNMPFTISGGGATDTFTYSPEHDRARLVTQLSAGTQTIIYLHPGGGNNLFYEAETKTDATVENRHYVNAGTQLVGMYVIKSSYAAGDGPQMRYFHTDSLGSIAVVSNEAGTASERLSYEPFGKRRFPTGASDPTNTVVGVTTDRGFTGQEQLDEVGLIHMNGRVYDPLVARFMTPDPTVPYPFNLQTFNRYSYAYNNPLRFIDPSGFCGDDDGGPCPSDTTPPGGGDNQGGDTDFGGTGTGADGIPVFTGGGGSVGTAGGQGAGADPTTQPSFQNQVQDQTFLGSGLQISVGNSLGLGLSQTQDNQGLDKWSMRGFQGEAQPPVADSSVSPAKTYVASDVGFIKVADTGSYEKGAAGEEMHRGLVAQRGGAVVGSHLDYYETDSVGNPVYRSDGSLSRGNMDALVQEGKYVYLDEVKNGRFTELNPNQRALLPAVAEGRIVFYGTNAEIAGISGQSLSEVLSTREASWGGFRLWGFGGSPAAGRLFNRLQGPESWGGRAD